MRRKLVLALVAALVGILTIAVMACSPTQPTSPSVTNVYVNNAATNNNGGGPGGDTKTGGLPAGSTVHVGGFGQNCPPGVAAPADGHVLKLTCQLALTLTPKGPNGELLPPAVTGTSPDSFGIVEGTQYARSTPWDSEPFNVNVVGVSAGGPFIAAGVVKGLKSDQWVGQVVAAAAAASDNVWGASAVLYDANGHAIRAIRSEDFGLAR